jgi:hypothetical protein
MSQRLRVLIAVAALTLCTSSTAFAANASIEQTRNGVATATTTPIPSWVSGNAGASNSHYLESHSIPYRTIMTGLPTDGTVIELTIDYAIKKSNQYAIDYLTQYQRLLPHVGFSHSNPEVINPLTGVSGVSALVTTAPIPLPTKNLVVDPDGTGSDPAAPQPVTSAQALPASERVMTLFGGTLIDVTYVTEGDVSLATSTSDTQVKVRFTANSATAVLAWGGHIACRWDWGFNGTTPRSAGGISGSSYHMALVTWSLGSLGSQDRSMSTDAVYPVPKCGVTNLGPFCAGTTNVHTAPTGMESYSWTLIGNTSGAVHRRQQHRLVGDRVLGHERRTVHRRGDDGRQRVHEVVRRYGDGARPGDRGRGRRPGGVREQPAGAARGRGNRRQREVERRRGHVQSLEHRGERDLHADRLRDHGGQRDAHAHQHADRGHLPGGQRPDEDHDQQGGDRQRGRRPDRVRNEPAGHAGGCGGRRRHQRHVERRRGHVHAEREHAERHLPALGRRDRGGQRHAHAHQRRPGRAVRRRERRDEDHDQPRRRPVNAGADLAVCSSARRRSSPA